MNAANPDKSRRMQRVLRVLQRGREVSTMTIVREARVAAVNSIVAELRQAGHNITCQRRDRNGTRIWYYRLVRA